MTFLQVTSAAQGGGVLSSASRQLGFDLELDFYTPAGASGARRSLGLQLIESPTQDTLSIDDQPVACDLCFMDDDDFITSIDETVSMGSTESDVSM